MEAVKSTTLDTIELLKEIPPDHRAALAQRCAWRTYAAGEQILARDADSDEVLFIVEGRVRVVNYSRSGREVYYAVIEDGGHVGELSAIDGQPRSASVLALDACRIASIAGSTFMELIEVHPNAALALLRRLTRIIRESDERITELSTIGAMQRVYRELLRLAEDEPNDPDRMVVKNLPTQETLASRLGTTRETVARVLAHLARSKTTKRSGRTLMIHDREQLELLADPTGDYEL